MRGLLRTSFFAFVTVLMITAFSPFLPDSYTYVTKAWADDDNDDSGDDNDDGGDDNDDGGGGGGDDNDDGGDDNDDGGDDNDDGGDEDDDDGDDSDDDDDDDDDDFDDDDDLDDDAPAGGGGGDARSPEGNRSPSGEGRSPNRGNRRAVRNEPPSPPPPARAQAEIVALGLQTDELDTLSAQGYQIIETRDITAVDGTAVRLRVPEGTSLDQARTQVRAINEAATADFNHFYRPGQSDAATLVRCEGEHCMQLSLVAVTPAHDVRAVCGAGARIGVIDTGINPTHETFDGRRLDVLTERPEGLEPSGAQHGTAVASLLIGNPESRSPGLLPEAEVIAVDAFHTAGSDERSDVYTLVQAMERLSTEEVPVINMSLAGPPNDLLEEMVDRLTEQGIVLVAAAGNAGPRAEPAYPGAYEEVIAVTAINRYEEVYRRAGQGDHIDLAAPGVGVWTAASIRGARPKTGTSFAVPFVSAAVAALAAQNPDMTREELIATVLSSARDLGEEGRDPVFGHGLLQLSEICKPEGI